MQDVVWVFHIAAVHDLIGHEVLIKSREHDADRDAGDKQPDQFRFILSQPPKGLPQLEQNLPLFTVPHAQVHSPAGAGLPQFEQNLPVFFAPQLHVHSFALTGAGLPQFAQNLPVLPVCPHAQVQPAAAGAACCICAPCW